MPWPKDAFKPLPTALVLVLAVTLGVLVLGLSLVIEILRYPELRYGILPPLGDLLTMQLALEVPVVATLLIALPRLSGIEYRTLGFSMPTLRNLGIVGLGAAAMILITNLSAAGILTLLHSKHEQSVVALFKQVHDPGTLIYIFIFAVILAPFAEESVFRLFIFNLTRRYGGFWIGAIVSGLLFGAAHGDLIFLLPLALAGIILCSVYALTKNAWCSMMVHACFNAVATIQIFLPATTSHR